MKVNKVKANKVKANKAKANKVKANKVKANKVKANKAKASKVKANKATVNKAKASKAKVNKDEGQQGEGQQGEGQQGEGQQGEGQQGEGQQGQGQPGRKVPSDAKSSAQAQPPEPRVGPALPVDQDLGDAQANLEYAKKATDMVLDKLEEQAENPDSKLLEQMNWTKDDLQNFMQRWKEMKLKAESGNAADKKRYETALQSLGLLPQGQSSRKVDGTRDNMHGLLETAPSTNPQPNSSIASTTSSEIATAQITNEQCTLE